MYNVHMAKKSKRLWTPSKIKALRERLDLTQQELADKLGATRRAVAAWEDDSTEHARAPSLWYSYQLTQLDQASK